MISTMTGQPGGASATHVAGGQHRTFRYLFRFRIECGETSAQDSRVFGPAKNSLSLSFETRKAPFSGHFSTKLCLAAVSTRPARLEIGAAA